MPRACLAPSSAWQAAQRNRRNGLRLLATPPTRVDDGPLDAATMAAASRRGALQQAAGGLAALAGVLAPLPAAARPEGVNKPELLAPRGADGSAARVMQMADVNYLTKGQLKAMDAKLKTLEEKTSVKLRVLCQRYPQTPGLAIKDYWDINDRTIVLIADRGLKGTSNILNFNVGEGFKLDLPSIFWSRLSGKYGSTFYIKENGEDQAIIQVRARGRRPHTILLSSLPPPRRAFVCVPPCRSYVVGPGRRTTTRARDGD